MNGFGLWRQKRAFRYNQLDRKRQRLCLINAEHIVEFTFKLEGADTYQSTSKAVIPMEMRISLVLTLSEYLSY